MHATCDADCRSRRSTPNEPNFDAVVDFFSSFAIQNMFAEFILKQRLGLTEHDLS